MPDPVVAPDAVAAAAAASAAGATPPAGDQGGDKGKGDDKGQQPEGAPEKYEAFTLPDGVELHGPTQEKFLAAAKELNLSQASAQKLASLAAEHVQALEALQVEAWEKVTAGWMDQAKADKEIGGSGFDANVVIAQKAMTKFGTPELKEALKETGLGNHPELVRFFLRVGKAISEDAPPAVGSDPNASKDVASILYGKKD